MNSSQQRWNGSLEFLKAIRTGWCNDDYMQFLVDRVWKIDKPVRVVDFGCGFGYMGMMLLPLLPAGSSYTGIDFSSVLLDDARRLFDNSGYTTEFIEADFNDYVPQAKFDMAISQAVLRHLPNASDVLEKMVKSVVSGGLVVCMETDLEIEKAGLHFSGLDYPSLGLTELYRKIYRNELAKGGRDYRIAVKIPILMQELGLVDVGVRMNDSVKFVNPSGSREEHRKQYEATAEAWGWDKPFSPEERHETLNRLIAGGLSFSEAEAYTDGQAVIKEYVMNNRDRAFILQVPGTLISYGRKI